MEYLHSAVNREYKAQWTKILLGAFKHDAVTNFVGLPTILRKWIMTYYYQEIVENSELVLKEEWWKLQSICAYEIKGWENDKKGDRIPILKRVLDRGAQSFIDRATRGRYSLASGFFQLMEELEKSEMPWKHLYLSQMWVEVTAQGQWLWKNMVQ